MVDLAQGLLYFFERICAAPDWVSASLRASSTCAIVNRGLHRGFRFGVLSFFIFMPQWLMVLRVFVNAFSFMGSTVRTHAVIPFLQIIQLSLTQIQRKPC
jgi:hypothetical protein